MNALANLFNLNKSKLPQKLQNIQLIIILNNEKHLKVRVSIGNDHHNEWKCETCTNMQLFNRRGCMNKRDFAQYFAILFNHIEINSSVKIIY